MNNLTITLIQSDIHWEEIEANLAMFEEKIWKIEGKTDMIILPEMFSTGFSMNVRPLAEPMNSKTFRWMKQQAVQTGAVILGSYIVNDGGSFFNRLLAVRPDGTFEKYDKRHLFGLAGEDKDFQQGVERLLFEVNGWKILPLICYDLRFPEWSRSRNVESNLYEYDLVVYIASWPKPRVNAWDTLLKARAIENQAFVAGVNRIGSDGTGAEYVGHSMVGDYFGNEMAYLDDKDCVETVTLEHTGLESFRSRFPFQKDADKFDFV